MRRKTLRDFSISSERKLEHWGGLAGGNGPNLIYFRSYHTICFHGRKVVLIFQLSDWGIMLLDSIRASTQLPLCKWYPSPKQWIYLELKPISVLKWGLSVLCGICVYQSIHIRYRVVSDYFAAIQEMRTWSGLFSLCGSCVLGEIINCWGFVSIRNGEQGEE